MEIENQEKNKISRIQLTEEPSSWVWRNMKMIKIGGKNYEQCTICSKNYVHKKRDGTGNLAKHLRTGHSIT